VEENKLSFYASSPMNIISLSWLGYFDEVKDLVAKNGKEIVHQTDDFGDTALHAAAAKGRLELVQFLISNGANVNAQNHMGSTPLHKAMVAKFDQIAITKLLLKSGADANVKNKNEFLPEDLARDSKVFDLLLGESAITAEVSLQKDMHGS
jgi:ankyrin repeat protein